MKSLLNKQLYPSFGLHCYIIRCFKIQHAHEDRSDCIALFVATYPHPLDGRTGSLLERVLRQFSAAARGKNDRAAKILDKALFAKRIDGAEQQDHKLRGGVKVAIWDAEDVKYVYGELVNSYKPYVENELVVKPKPKPTMGIGDL